MQKLVCVIFLMLSVTFSSKAQDLVESYIEAFQYIAVSEMERTGIPASVKLAQGLLESNWGRSELSTFAHNHFGIKCGSKWEGNTYYKVDDDKDEHGNLKESCFRVFESDEASYIAHSEFLLANKRYAFLFDYGSTDYKAWAKGLKKAGYATDPKYPSKIIGVIKKYNLSKFDYMAADELDLFAQVDETQEDENLSQAEIAFMQETMEDLDAQTNDVAAVEEVYEGEEKEKSFWAKATENSDFTRNYVKYKKKWQNNVKSALANDTQKSKSRNSFNFENLLNEVVELGNTILGEESKEAPTSFPDMETHNGVKLTWAEGGETIQDIAARTGIHVNDIYEFNDKVYKIKQELLDKTIIYLEPKKTSFTGSRDTHEVRHGEKIEDIAQRYAVTERSLRKRNYLKDSDELVHGEILYLKGIRTELKPKVRKSRRKTSDSFTFTGI